MSDEPFDVETGEILGPEPPRPLMRELPPPSLFPVDSLGPILGTAAKAIADLTQAPMAICGNSVLAAAALACQAQRDVVLPQGTVKPISLFLISVARTGERKSEADRHALRPIAALEETLRLDHEGDKLTFKNSKDAFDEARKAALRKAADLSRAEIAHALDLLGVEPSAPLDPLLTCSEPTFEGLVKLFSIGRPSLGIFSAEGGAFMGGHGLSADAKTRTAAGICAAWDGEAIKRVRADGATILPGRRLSLHLMVQPGVAAGFLGDSALEDQGLLSRVLVSAPDSLAGSRPWKDPSPDSDIAMKRYFARLMTILEMALPLKEGTANELRPRLFPSANRRGR